MTSTPTTPALPLSLPPTVPALLGWVPGTGEWGLTATTRVVAATDTARFALLGVELFAYLHPVADPDRVPATGESVPVVQSGAVPGDIIIVIDEARSDELGVEGCCSS